MVIKITPLLTEKTERNKLKRKTKGLLYVFYVILSINLYTKNKIVFYLDIKRLLSAI